MNNLRQYKGAANKIQDVCGLKDKVHRVQESSTSDLLWRACRKVQEDTSLAGNACLLASESSGGSCPVNS